MDGRMGEGYVICATCGLVGHTMGKCPDRVTAATTVWAAPRAADVPRICVCGQPTLHTTDGLILNDGAHTEHSRHVCGQRARLAA